MESRAKAHERQLSLTKPSGSLGQLESIAEDFASWQQTALPSLDRIGIRIFAADHGVCAQGVSAFPSEVTAQMVGNFLAGGAAISVLSAAENADFAVVNLGTVRPLLDSPGLINLTVAPGTADFTDGPAMTERQLRDCLAAGRTQVENLECQLFIAGDMGIGNTSSASAISAALLKLSPAEVVGRGTGIDDATLRRKQAVVARALEIHGQFCQQPIEVLRRVGGLEIAAMCGAYIRSAQLGIPILLDGFISTAAALLAVKINPGVQPWLMAGHQSAEMAHRLLLRQLALVPVLNLGMRLGEGSGAAVALSIIRSALLLHGGMATFAEAGVADSDDT